MTYKFIYFVSFGDDGSVKKYYEVSAESYQDAVTSFSYFIRHCEYTVVDFSPNYSVVSSSGEKSFRKFKERGIFINFVS